MKDLYDLIIIGGGCSGLQLANEIIWEYKKRTKSKKILILENRAKYIYDKTWCFWSDSSSPYVDWSYKNWNKWSFSEKKGPVLQHYSKKYKYYCLRSIDFYTKSLQLINSEKNAHIILNQNITDIKKVNSIYKIYSDSNSFLGKKIIDCRYEIPKKVNNGIWQIFYGIEFKCNNFLNPDTVCLMRDISTHKNGITFVYLLPFGFKHGLIQITYIGNKKIDLREIESKSKETFKNFIDDNYEIVRKESGTILQHGHLPISPSIKNFKGGSSTGIVRPSSGYAFVRINKWAKSTSNELIKKKIKKKSSIEKIINFMDYLFVKIIIRNPNLLPKIFISLARNLNANSFAKFMSDNPNIFDLFFVILASPKKTFLKALFNKK